jgi:hypothetical protein
MKTDATAGRMNDKIVIGAAAGRGPKTSFLAKELIV